MELYFTIMTFVFGTIFGSFYNVVGDRLPEGKSIVKPRSHCPKCGHVLKWYELIPVLSYLFQLGKCKSCKSHIPIIHPMFEIFCGIMFMLTYKVFGFTPEALIAITFISVLLILIISDINYYIIPDEILIVGIVLLIIQKFVFMGLEVTFDSLLNGTTAFVIMLLLKLMGDFIFKKESMGGGDIKLMFLFGFVIGWDMSLLSIFLGSLIGFPISIGILLLKKTNIIPFGPFLSFGAMIILLNQFTLDTLLKILL